MKKTILFLLGIFILFGCEKWNLERDNPIDIKAEINKLKYSRHEVVVVGGSDDIINSGETVYLKVYVKNNSEDTLYGVKAIISTLDTCIFQLSPTTPVSYYTDDFIGDYILPEEEGYGDCGEIGIHYTVTFNVSNNTPIGTQIPFNIDITDESNSNWSDSFSIDVN